MNCGARRNSGCRTAFAASSGWMGLRCGASSSWAASSTASRADRRRRPLPVARAGVDDGQGQATGSGARPSARLAFLVWRERRFGCERWGRTSTETDPELPPRQRVTRRFRRRLLDRARAGGAHAETTREERTTRYQAGRAFEAGVDERGRRRHDRPARRQSLDAAARRPGHELATVVSDSTAAGWWRCSMAAAAAPGSAVCARRRSGIGSRSRSPRSTPTRPTARRSAQRCRGRGSWSTTSSSCGAPTRRSTASAVSANASVGPRSTPRGRGGPASTAGASHLPLSPPAPQGPRAALRARPARALRAVRARAHLAEGWRLNEAFRSIDTAPEREEAERRLEAFFAAVERPRSPRSRPSPPASGSGRKSCSPTSTSRPQTDTREGGDQQVKVIKRRAYGLPTFDGFRDRVLIASG